MALKLTKYQRKLFKLIAGGALYTGMMILGTYLLSLFVENNQSLIPIYMMIIMLMMIVVYIYRVIIAKHKEKLLFIRYGTLTAIFLTLAVFSILTYINPTFYYFLGTGYAIGLIVDRTFSLFHHHKGRNIFLAVLIYTYAVLLIIVSFLPLMKELEDPYFVYSLMPFTLIIISFVDAVKLVFSGLRRQTLVSIIKKTYTIEILYGLVTLMLSTSILLTVVDDAFNNFGDALWYCFAVVTTIGFGDFAATSFVGRMLTVVLGIYGIIVVALITSIIVNFYNESSTHDKGDKDINEMVKELDEQREPSKEEIKEEDK